jgi:hypothetical protein
MAHQSGTINLFTVEELREILKMVHDPVPG